ncbi:hypothetical protein NLI96_g7467 [Meripilus lineatus]|uniref:Uncharacterized protein n=1 Tax=Meripilus lineatus TaxID=2056292 RepID=A0AAD5YC15_9APHY|nr:hypothetical protein NLI96_g7467 [Physisporinus lineatus]
MVARGPRSCLLLTIFSLLFLSGLVAGYEVSFTDKDYERQFCSGMWGGKSTYINVTFDAESQGQLAMIVYEWKDMPYLGKVTSKEHPELPNTYVCTSDALRNGFCERYELGKFILNLPSGKSINDTSFWSARVGFGSNESRDASSEEVASSGFWDNPEGNPHPPDEYDTYVSPWKRRIVARRSSPNGHVARQDPQPLNPSPQGILWYHQPIQYIVRKTGYYCVAMVPVTVLPNSNSARQAKTDVPEHPPYYGTVHFHNTFDGKLPATDYPKVNFYFSMFLLYTLVGAGWGWLCYQNLQDLLPIQLSLLIEILIIHSAYYRYLNAHGRGTTSTVFLIVVAILDAGRNALSFFLLLVVSLGLSVVKESLGRTMLRCQILAVAHFIFGVLYAVGIVELELELASPFVLLIFVIPLAFTLSGFLLWILYSLNAMFDELAQDEEDAEDYDMEALERRTEALGMHDDDDTSTLVGNRGPNDEVVFEIGDDGADGSDDEDHSKKRRGASHQDGLSHEREGLMRDQ